MKIIGPGALLCCVVNFFPLSCGTPPSAPDAAPAPERVYETIRISSFNIQIFGAAKMAKPGAAEILAGIVSRFDITAVQEVRSVLIDPVERFMALLPAYSSVLGPREGRTSSREQYWVIYDTGKFTVLGAAVYPDPEDVFERNPLGVFFAAGDNFDFILINNHIRPGAAAAEIDALPEVIAWFQHYFDEPDALVVGDFNADGSYYDETLLASVFPPADYEIIISNQLDTTVASSDNTYDRFIITRAAREDYTGNRGVLRFDDEYALGAYGLSAAELSDHYPIWAEFYLGKDTD